MTLIEILPSLKQLDHREKLKAVQFLVNEIAREEEVLFSENQVYEIWSPYDSFEASETLQQMLIEENENVRTS